MLADAKLGDPARTDELFPAYATTMPVITPSGLPGSGGAGRRPAALGDVTPATSRPDGALPDPIAAGRGRRLARSPRLGQRPPRDSPASTPPTGSPPTTRSARTTGSSARRCRRPAARSSPTIRTSASRCRRSGSSTASTAGPSATACPYDVAGVSFPGVPGRRPRPQRAHRVGRDEHRPGRPGPLHREGRPGGPERLPASASESIPFDVRHETIKVAGRRRRRPRGPRRRATARSSTTSTSA